MCERILEETAREYVGQIDLLYVRVGQISGSKRGGYWNPDEHFSGLIKSSQAIRRLPRLQGVSAIPLGTTALIELKFIQTCSWVPVDCATETLSELLLTTVPTQLVYHLENPVRQSWHDVLTDFASQLNLPNTDLLPFDDWLQRVCTAAEDIDSENPAKKLADFFKSDFRHMACGNVILDTSNLRAISPTLRGVGAVDQATLGSYVDYWRSIGFLK